MSTKFKDETGNRYERLFVVERAENLVSDSGKSYTRWKCQCDCGNISIVRSCSLRSGRTNSCGCLNKEILSDRASDLIEKRFGLLLVISRYFEEGTKFKEAKWNCLCDCGNITISGSDALKSGRKKSCGCSRVHEGKEHPGWQGHGEINQGYWGRLQRGAKQRGIEFNITIEQAWELFLGQEGKCSLSDMNLFFATYDSSKDQTASLDRIDSTIREYSQANCQWVHKDINQMKWAHDQGYFVDLCVKVAETMTVKVN